MANGTRFGSNCVGNVVGPGSQADAPSRGLEWRIPLTRRRDDNDLVASYHRADLFVMTWLSQSFGLVEMLTGGLSTLRRIAFGTCAP
jgi:hypothetical protein